MSRITSGRTDLMPKRKSNQISVVVPCLTEEPWQVHLTKAVINIARETTKIPYELIIVEAVGNEFDNGCDKYYRNPHKGFVNADLNKGMDLAEGNIIVVLTNDVFVKTGWLEALVDCFDIKSCGMASLGTSDHREISMPVIREGIWCPLMAIPNRPDFRFDAETFPAYWGDCDLVMKIYNAGFQAYRNRRVICDHLGRATVTEEHVLGKPEEIEKAKNKFIERHQTSHHLIFRVLMEGFVV